MRVLVLGGAGHVGRQLVPHLLHTHRHEVRVLDRAPSTVDGAESVVADVLDAGAVAAAATGADAVVHLAMMGPPGLGADPDVVTAAYAVNVASVHLALRAADAAGCRSFVHISSLSVFADYLHRPIPAGTPADESLPYGLTKRLGEEVCAALAPTLDLAVCSLRLAHPTPDDDWPLWRVEVDSPAPKQVRTGDGTVLPALAAADLAAAVVAAIAYRGPYRPFTVTGGRTDVTVPGDDTADVLGWAPRRR